ncbi:hypothetical protein F4703DRAFT_1916207 [Phycomyces blakesleeanus]
MCKKLNSIQPQASNQKTGNKEYKFLGHKYIKDSGGFSRAVIERLNPYPCKSICSTCGKDFSRIGNYTRHQKTHTKEKEKCFCQTCGKAYSNKSNLDRHTKIKHTNP